MSRPNVLHILTDQQRFDSIAAHGSPYMRTPVMDRLCAEGTSFTRAYSPSPVCVPARASTIYGQYPWHTGCYENAAMNEHDRQSLMDMLAGAGYDCMGVGKVHFCPDPHALRGFHRRLRQEEYIRDPAQDDYVAWLRAQNEERSLPHGLRGSMYYVPQPRQLPAELHPTTWVADRCIDYLRDRGADADPFYLYAGFIAPHPPINPPEPWDELYAATDMPLPILPSEQAHDHLWINDFQNRYKCRDRGHDGFLVANIRAGYAASVSFVDYHIGRIVAELEQQGLLDDTLIILHSDHGDYLGDYGCWGKRSMHDVSARVPLILRLPSRFAAGQTCAVPTSLVDIAPTLGATCDCTCSSHAFDGEDLAAIAADELRQRRVYAEYSQGDSAIYMATDGRHKYIYSAGDRRSLLFDLLHDPQERNNQSGSMFHRHIEASLKADLIAHLRAAGDDEAIAGDDFCQYDGPSLKAEWKWWEMDTTTLAQRPNTSLLINVPEGPDVPAAYR